jgi:hypothetical protein
MSPSERLAEDPEFHASAGRDPIVGPEKPRMLGMLGPGLITGAADDDPSVSPRIRGPARSWASAACG